jgi:hypothetical protein
MMSCLRILRLCACIAGLAVASCGHDTARTNPLDPGLTTAVELSVTGNDTAGTATLNWTPYTGDFPFSSYRVLRNVARSTEVDTLAVVDDAGALSFTDSTAVIGVSYLYRVAVVNEHGLQTISAPRGIDPLALPAVDITGTLVSSATATSQLTWTPYSGPRFAAYRVLRTDALTSQSLTEITDRNITTWIDSHLTGNTAYAYRIMVVTTRGEEIESAPTEAAIHPVISSWDLPEMGPGMAGYVRLQWQDGNLLALVSIDEAGVSEYIYSSDGQQLATRRLVSPYVPSGARAVALARDQDGRCLALLSRGLTGTSALYEINPDGSPVQTRIDLLEGATPGVPQGADLVAARLSFFTSQNSILLDDINITDAAQHVLSEDFADLPQLPPFNIRDWTWGAWQGYHTTGMRGWLYSLRNATLQLPGLTWQQPLLQVELAGSGTVAITLGDSTRSARLSLKHQGATNTFEFDWTYLAANDASGDAITVFSTRRDLPGIQLFFVPYHLSLGLQGGRPVAQVTLPTQLAPLKGESIGWAALSRIDDQFAMTIDDRSYSMAEDGALTELSQLASPVADMRFWLPAGERFARVAVCQPELDQIRTGTVIRASRWDQALRETIGPRLGSGVVSLFYPISFDRSPDGRMYVLDAGNQRIVAVDAEGRYITQWSHGADHRRFGFGAGEKLQQALAFSGSIAVDDDGNIYVADPGNGRIHKFSP